MSERVEARGSQLAWNARTIQRRIEHIFSHDIGMEWRSIRFAKDRIRWPNVSRVLKMLFQYTREHVAKRNRSDTGHGFCCHQLAMPEALFDPQCSSFEIDVLPLQSE
jgi:hypothetical protein